MTTGRLFPAIALVAAQSSPCPTLGHGAVTFPAPRQSLDRALKIGAGCPIGKGGQDSNGQACFWFSNGCNTGCEECDGTHPSFGHDDESYTKFLYKGLSKSELVGKKMTGNATIAGLWSPKRGDMTIDPSLKPVPGNVMPKKGQPSPKPVINSTCGRIVQPTLCDERLRTLNTQAPVWHSGGHLLSEPVEDARGSAGH
eukprot:COSAG05_NODE_800_length_7226_cov_4.300126_9_plen_198_part_00